MRIERELFTDSGDRVVLYMEFPQKETRSHEFSCKIGISGSGIEEAARIYGVDAFQAIILSIRHVPALLGRASKAAHPRRLLWEFGPLDADF